MPLLNTSLKSVLSTNSKHLELLKSLNLKTVEDFINYYPRTYTDASGITQIADAKAGEAQTFFGTLSNFFMKRLPGGRAFIRAVLTDETGKIEIVWFNQTHIMRMYKAGMQVFATGKPTLHIRKLSLTSPQIEHRREEQLHTGRIIPIYHETEGLKSAWIREKLKPILNDAVEEIEEYLPKNILEKEHLMPLKEALLHIHYPEKEDDLTHARTRLAFDEIFLLQLKALHKKWIWQHAPESKIKAHHIDRGVIDQLIGDLPFALTNAQKQTLEAILADLEKDIPMSRLVQGDVGSGKTIVAGLAALAIIKNGQQVALMAPTEILIKQHVKTLYKFFGKTGISMQTILGSTPAAARKEIITQLATGTLDLIIGTHALIQEDVAFKQLGLAIIDEQHRFGVRQREILRHHGAKTGGPPHLLSLSATPIPRTLAMTLYGDQDLSIIDELPPGRQPIETHIVPERKRRDAYDWIRKQVGEGRQVFVVCPLIDDSEELELTSVMESHEELSKHIFPDLSVHFLHGKMKQEEKDSIMERFGKNEIAILVSTSVIEVGIDVPNATIMIIEGAERFGLSQLHQFRGRVGRGEHKSYCFLFTKKQSEQSTKRLGAMVKYHSGFALAEIDLEMRGPGEIYGVRQSGIPDLRLASLTDAHTISKARQYAAGLLEKDPYLKTQPLLKNKLAQTETVYVND